VLSRDTVRQNISRILKGTACQDRDELLGMRAVKLDAKVIPELSTG
jgi:hypothetical protein